MSLPCGFAEHDVQYLRTCAECADRDGLPAQVKVLSEKLDGGDGAGNSSSDDSGSKGDEVGSHGPAAKEQTGSHPKRHKGGEQQSQ